MKKILHTAILLISLTASAQDNATLTQVINNNHYLKSQRNQIEAQKSENSLDLSLEDVEVSASVLSGNHQQEPLLGFGISQTLNWDIITGQRRKTANLQSEQLEHQYRQDVAYVWMEARKRIVGIIHCNRTIDHLKHHLEDAERFVRKYGEIFRQDSTQILDYDKACHYRASLQSEMNEIQCERKILMDELALLNGGQPLEVLTLDYDETAVSSNFEEWYNEVQSRLPTLSVAKSQVAIARQQYRTTRVAQIPALTIGYLGEKDFAFSGGPAHGATLGLSIPVWNSARSVRNARKQQQAAISALEQAQLDTRQEYMNLHTQAMSLRQRSNAMLKYLRDNDNEELMTRTLESGKLSFFQFLTQIIANDDFRDSALEAERDYHLLMTQLLAY